MVPSRRLLPEHCLDNGYLPPLHPHPAMAQCCVVAVEIGQAVLIAAFRSVGHRHVGVGIVRDHQKIPFDKHAALRYILDVNSELIFPPHTREDTTMNTSPARFELPAALVLLARAVSNASGAFKRDEPSKTDYAMLMGLSAYSALINEQIDRAKARIELSRKANLSEIVLVPRIDGGADIIIREEAIDMLIGGAQHSHFSRADTDTIKLIAYGVQAMTDHAESARICNWLIRHVDLFDTDQEIETIMQDDL